MRVQSCYGPRAGWLLGLGPLDGPEKREAEGPQWKMEVCVMVELMRSQRREVRVHTP